MYWKDEGIRYDASLEALAGLKTVTEGGVITAGNASQITDGAAAVMVCNEAGLKKLTSDPIWQDLLLLVWWEMILYICLPVQFLLQKKY